MKKTIIMSLLLIFVLTGCSSPVDDYVQKVEELKINESLVEIENDLSTLVSSNEEIMAEDALDNLDNKVSELQGKINTISVDDEEAKDIHSHLSKAINEWSILIDLLKDHNKLLIKTEQLVKEANEINKAAVNIDEELSKGSAVVDDKAYNYFITQKNYEKLTEFFDNLDNIIKDNKDVEKQFKDNKKIVNNAPASTPEGQKIIEMLKDLINLSEKYYVNSKEANQIEKSLPDFSQKFDQHATAIDQEINEWRTALEQ